MLLDSLPSIFVSAQNEKIVRGFSQTILNYFNTYTILGDAFEPIYD
jgi:hypothetical protein